MCSGQMDRVQCAQIRRPERAGDHQNAVTHSDELDARENLAGSPAAFGTKVKHRAEDFGARDRACNEIALAPQEPPQRSAFWLAVDELDER